MRIWIEVVVLFSFCMVWWIFDCSGVLFDSVCLVVFKVLCVFFIVVCILGVMLLLMWVVVCLVVVKVLFKVFNVVCRLWLILLNGILESLLVMLESCCCNLFRLFGMVGSFSGILFGLICVGLVLGKKLIVMYSWFVSRLLLCSWVCMLCLISMCNNCVLEWCCLLVFLWKWWFRWFG